MLIKIFHRQGLLVFNASNIAKNCFASTKNDAFDLICGIHDSQQLEFFDYEGCYNARQLYISLTYLNIDFSLKTPSYFTLFIVPTCFIVSSRASTQDSKEY